MECDDWCYECDEPLGLGTCYLCVEEMDYGEQEESILTRPEEEAEVEEEGDEG